MTLGIFRVLAVTFFLVLALSQYARASVTDAALDVTYTATSTFAPVTDNTYDVFLTVDASQFSAGTGYLTAISLQYKTGSATSSSVTLVEAPGGIGDWSLEMPGGLNKSGCDTSNPSSGDVCFQNVSADTAVPGGPYDFEFAVTMPGTDALTAASDLKVAYNTAMDNSGKNLGLTSQRITIDLAPEPGTMVLFGTGLLAFAGMLRRKMNVGVLRQFAWRRERSLGRALYPVD